MHVRLAVAALACALLTLPALAQSPSAGTLQKVVATKTLLLGYQQESVPFSFADTSGNPAGYSVDLCKRIAAGIQQQLNLPTLDVKWVPITLANRFEMVVAGKVDLECATSTNTISRQKIVDFSLMTWVDGGSFITPGNVPAKGVADLNGKKVGAVKDTTTDKALRSAIERAAVRAEVVSAPSHFDGMRMLAEGKIDAYAADQTVLIGLAVAAGDKFVVSLSEQGFSYEPYGFSMRRDDADFKQAVNRVLAQLYRTGEIGPIYERWFGKLGKPGPLLAAMYTLNALPE
jgi:ABC-type amino acid transport substrate-binding protein